MKPILIFVVMLFTFIAAKAQEASYHPFCTEGKTWTVDTDWHFANGMFCQDKYRLEGDTLIADKVCKKMYMQSYTSDKYYYRGAFYDDGPRVMYFPKGSDEARLVYDFSLQVGDEASFYSIYEETYETLRVLSVGNRSCDGRNFRTLELNGRDDGKVKSFITWMEGIGSTSTPLDNWSYPVIAGMFSVSLRCCTIDSEMFYFNEPDHETMGQEYCEIRVPFTQEGKRWAVKYTSVVPDATEYVKEYTLQGDTIIAGLTAMRMFEDGCYVGAFFDRGVQTFFIAPGTTTPHLYYNFCARCCEYTRVWHTDSYAQLYACVCGNGWYSFGDSFLQLTKLDVASFEGRDADYNAAYAIMDNELTRHHRFEWLEGVGAMAGPMQNWEYPDLEGAPVTQLIACWTSDAIFYDTDNYVANRTLNPDGIVSSPSISCNTAAYDLSGRRIIDTKNAHGVHVMGRKKFVK